MLLRGALGAGDAAPSCSLLVDTTLTYPVALDGAAWTKAGVPSSGLRALPNGGNLRHGVVPLLRLGAFDVPHVPGLEGDGAVKEREQGLGVDIDGLLGSGLLATFRVTLFDGGRSLWLEDMPPEALQPPPPIDMPPDLDIPLEEYEEEEEAPKPAPGKGAPKPKAPASPNAAPKKP
jgi:hypothetical protein